MFWIIASQASFALSAAEVSQVARQITLQINGQKGNGSGVIIQRAGNTYTVLTAAHAVVPGDVYAVVLPDESRINIQSSTIKTLPKVDLAILQFNSPQSYGVAEIGDSVKVTEGSVVFVAGFPQKTAAISESVYHFTQGQMMSNRNKPFTDGYELIYSNNTLPGMSGGPVLDVQGRLIGIHGRADTSNQLQEPDINPSIVIKTGFNLGVPINTFLRLIPKVDAKLVFHPAPSLPMSGAGEGLTVQDYLTKGIRNERVGRYQEAIAAYDQAIRLDPKSYVAYFSRGLSQAELEDNQKALADFTRVIQLVPLHAPAYYQRGLIYVRLGDKSRAKADLKKAIELYQQKGDRFSAQKSQAALKKLN